MAGVGKEFPFNLQNGGTSVRHKRRGRQQQRRRHLNRVMDVEEILVLLEELKREQEQEKFEQSQRIRRERELEERRQLSRENGLPEPEDMLCETCEKLAMYSDLDPEAQRRKRYAQQKRRQKLQKRILDIELLQQFLRELKAKQEVAESEDEDDNDDEVFSFRKSSWFFIVFLGIFFYFMYNELYGLF